MVRFQCQEHGKEGWIWSDDMIIGTGKYCYNSLFQVKKDYISERSLQVECYSKSQISKRYHFAILHC